MNEFLVGKLKDDFSVEDLGEIESPDFDNVGLCHDWKEYIDEDIADRWGHFQLETKIAFFMMAERMADAEEWE